MSKRDLSAFFDETLEYPGVPSKAHPGGKDYKVPSVDADTGLRLTAYVDVAMKARAGGEVDTASLKLSDDEERNLYQQVLGPVYDEMVADGVPWLLLQHVGQDAFACFAMSTEVADSILESQGKSLARPNRATRRAGAKAGRRSARASGATETPTREQASIGSSTPPSVSEDSGQAQAV